MEALKTATKEKVGVELVLHVKPKGEDGKQQVDDLIGVINGGSSSLGVIQKVPRALSWVVARQVCSEESLSLCMAACRLTSSAS